MIFDGGGRRKAHRKHIYGYAFFPICRAPSFRWIQRGKAFLSRFSSPPQNLVLTNATAGIHYFTIHTTARDSYLQGGLHKIMSVGSQSTARQG